MDSVEKICTACKVNKKLEEYYFSKTRNLYYWECKLCTNSRSKKYRQNKPHYYKIYKDKNKEKIIQNHKIWNLKNKEYMKIYRNKNKDRIAEQKRQWAINNKERYDASQRKYYINNKEKIITKLIINKKIRKQNDINFKLRSVISGRVRSALKYQKTIKNNSCWKYIGLETLDQLKTYIETKFQPGMSWNNWNFKGWHIDHIKPLISFDLTKEEERFKAFNYTNLQPLWWYDNLSKGAKIK